MAMTNKMVFQKFDYGFIENFLRYGQSSPPAWDVTKWNVDTVLIGGTRDEFATPMDITNLKSVTNANKVQVYSMQDWDHFTFLFARDMKPLKDVFEKELP